MYGTIAMMRCKPGGVQWVRNWVDVQSKRGMKGWIYTSIYQSDADPNTIWVAAAFESREAYFANADTPIQDQLYHQMLSGLEAPPEWHDGEIISYLTTDDPAVRRS